MSNIRINYRLTYYFLQQTHTTVFLEQNEVIVRKTPRQFITNIKLVLVTNFARDFTQHIV